MSGFDGWLGIGGRRRGVLLAGVGAVVVWVVQAVAPGLALASQQTFNYNGTTGSNGSQQSFVVPVGVTRVTIQASGAQGALGFTGGIPIAKGGSVTATVPVTPGETLAIFVGGQGGNAAPAPGSCCASIPGVAGYNGGGAGGGSFTPGRTGPGGGGYGGGGASDVRQSGSVLADRIVVAGGGGGSAGYGHAPSTTPPYFTYAGGPGGGTTGANADPIEPGTTCPEIGGGGTQAAGGAGGLGNIGNAYTAANSPYSGMAGGSGSGGAGGGSTTATTNYGGGGGGGGYYGGGGGGATDDYSGCGPGGGGGGSSFTESTATGVTHVQGVQTGDGQVVITYAAASATSVGSSQNPSTVGQPQPVTFTATVTGASPTGTVNFKDGSATIGSCGAQTVSGGAATCTTSTLGAGGHSITAVYGGDANNETSTSPIVTQTVNQASTTTAVGSSQSPSAVGQPVTFIAAVTGLSPGGTVSFKDGSTTIGSCGAQPLRGAWASCTTSSLGAGGHGITAVYSGDANNAASTSSAFLQSVALATGAGGQNPPPTVTPAGNQFTVSHVAARGDGSVSLSLTLPGAGAIDVFETANKSGKAALPKPERGRFAFATKHMAATGPATITVRVTPTARGKRLIAQDRRAHRALFINIWITYTPNGGTPRTQTKLHVRVTR